ncbi:MAG: hypothetical protein WD068_03395 [Candidatus Babeliales bacterium]
MKYYFLLLITSGTISCALLGSINLDDSTLRSQVTYTHNPTTANLTINLKNVKISCKTGSGSHGKLIGSYPNPDYKPFIEGFRLGGQAPHCLIYQIIST